MPTSSEPRGPSVPEVLRFFVRHRTLLLGNREKYNRTRLAIPQAPRNEGGRSGARPLKRLLRARPRPTSAVRAWLAPSVGRSPVQVAEICRCAAKMRHRWHRCADVQYKDGVDSQFSRIYRDKTPGQHLCRSPINARGCCTSVILCQRNRLLAMGAARDGEICPAPCSGASSLLCQTPGLAHHACAKPPPGAAAVSGAGYEKSLRPNAGAGFFHLSEVAARSWTASASSVWRSGRKRLRQSTNPKKSR